MIELDHIYLIEPMKICILRDQTSHLSSSNNNVVHTLHSNNEAIQMNIKMIPGDDDLWVIAHEKYSQLKHTSPENYMKKTWLFVK